MAGPRNAEAATLDTAVGTLITAYDAYTAVAVTGEPKNAAADYFLRSCLTRLAASPSLNYVLMQRMGLAQAHFNAPSLNNPSANALLVTIDPKASP